MPILDYTRVDEAVGASEQQRLLNAMRRSTSLIGNTNPDEFARDLGVAERIGATPDFVSRNRAEIEERERQKRLERDALLEVPEEARPWLADENNAKLVSDDFSAIGNLKFIFSEMPSQFGAGADELRLGELRFNEMFNDLTQEEQSEIAALKESLQGVRNPFDKGVAETALSGAARVAPQLAQQTISFLSGSAVGAAGAAGVGALIPGPEEVFTVPYAAARGGMMNAAITNFRQQTGMIRDDMLEIRNEAGQGLDANVVNGAAIVAGGLSAMADILPLRKFLATVPGLDKLPGVLDRKALRELMANPEAQRSLYAIGKKWGELAAAEGLVETLQEIISISSEEIAKAASDPDFKPIGFREAAARTGTAARAGFLIGGAIATPGSVAQTVVPRKPGQVTPEQAKEHVQAINQTVRESALFQRSPARFRDLIKSLSPDERLYINARAFSDVIGSMQPEQRSAILNQMPDLQMELPVAAETGADVSISKADYATFIAPVEGSDVLADFVKLDPADVSVAERNEVQEIIQQNPSLVEDIQNQRVQTADIPEQQIASIERVVKQALRDAGRSSLEADSAAALFANTLSRMAAPFGIDPAQALNETMLEFEAVGEDGTRLRSGSNVDVMLDDLRQIQQGRTPRGMNEQGRAAVEDFGRRLEQAGIPLEEAVSYEPDQLLARLYPVGESTMLEQSDGELLAPNGQPSNLNPRLYRVVRTPEFKAWFGDWENDPENASKVVDENGEPLVVYHGTVENIEQFSQPRRNSGTPEGVYAFSSSADIAASYTVPLGVPSREGQRISRELDEAWFNYDSPAYDDDLRRLRGELEAEGARLDGPQDGNVLPVFLNIRTPLVADAEGRQWRAVVEQDSSAPARDINNLAREAIEGGNDGLIVRNVIDAGAESARGVVADTFMVFSPEQIKSTQNVGSFAPQDARILFQFAGEQAKTADQNALSSAKEMLESGANPEEVRQQTGWFRSTDGKWRYEISDRDAKLKGIEPTEEGASSREALAMLPDILEHQKLFAAYPSLANVQVDIRIDPGLPSNDQEAYFSSGTAGTELEFGRDPEINIRANSDDSALDMLMHEVQHAIQEIEGFARGGSARTFFAEMKAEADEAFRKIESLNEQLRDAVGTPEYESLMQQKMSLVPVANKDPLDLREKANAKYRRLAGEVEARNTEGRRQYDDQQRANLPPDRTIDTLPEEQIVVFDSGFAMSAPDTIAPKSFDPQDARILQQQERGSITFGQDFEGNLRRVTIAFTKRANFSTAVHEFAHWSVATHRDFARKARERIAEGTDNSEIRRILADWEALKEQVGAEADEFTVDQEEQVARLFEAYAREGKAPSERLRRIFHRFMNWLTRIYKDVAELGVELNDEVRGIFNRWLASQDEIDAVVGANRSLTTIAQELGLDVGAIDRMTDYVNSSIAVAEEQVYKRLHAEQKRRETKAYKDDLAAMKRTVASEVEKRREYSTIRYLKESGNRIYIDPDANPEVVGLPPEDAEEFAPDTAEPVDMQEMERMFEEQQDTEQMREAVIDALMRQPPKKPRTLLSFIVSQGGMTERRTVIGQGLFGGQTRVEDGEGELEAVGITHRTMPGLINNRSGMHIDIMREAAAQEGYLPMDSDIADFLSLLDEDVKFRNVVAVQDEPIMDEIERYQELEAYAERLGIDIVEERKKRRKFGRYSELFTDDINSPDAVAADTIAELFGYETGRELVEALRATKDFDRVVAREAKHRLLEKYPDSQKSGRIRIEAADAIMNDRTILALDVMIKEMGKRAGRGAVSMKQFARVTAQQMVAGMPFSQANYGFRFEASREKSIRLALQQAKAGNPEGAMLHLQKAMVSQAVYKELQEFRETREKADKLFRRVNQKDKDLAASRDIDFIGAARAILSKFGMASGNFDMAAWLQDAQERSPGIAEDLVAMSAMVGTTGKPMEDLTIGEFREVYDAVRNVFWVARRMKEFELDEKKVQTEQAVAQMVEVFSELKQRPQLEGTQVRGKAKVDDRLMFYRAAVRRVEHWANTTQGGYDGPLMEYIVQPITDASSRYRVARTEWLKELEALFDKHKERLGERGKIRIDEINLTFSDRMELIGFLLHTGNESNLEKLLNGYNITREQWQDGLTKAIDNGVITRQDMQIVQELWDFAEGLKPLSQKAHKELYGYRFEEVEARPLVLPIGTFRGGYWPATIDREQVKDLGVKDSLQEVARYALASTNKGFTKSRVVTQGYPLSTDLKVAGQHLDTVLKFVYMEPAVRKVSRIVNNRDFKSALSAVDSHAKTAMLDAWLRRAARQSVSDPLEGADNNRFLNHNAFRWMNKAASRQFMMGNIANAVQNFTAFPIAARDVGIPSFMKSFAQYMAHPLRTNEAIAEKSENMRTRQGVNDLEATRRINALVRRHNKYRSILDFIDKHGYIFQFLTQKIVDNVTWLAAYNNALADGRSEADAVSFADSTVRRTMGGLQPEEISNLEGGPEIIKFLTKFYSYFNNQANYVGGEAAKIMRRAGWNGAPELFYLYLMAIAAPAVLGEAVMDVWRGTLPEDEDDDGSVADDWWTYSLFAQSRYISAGVPVLGQALNAVIGQQTEATFDDRISVNPAISLMDTTIRFTSRQADRVIEGDSGYRDTSAEVRDGLRAIGVITGLPLSQPAKPITYMVERAQGDGDDGPAETLRGLVGGPRVER